MTQNPALLVTKWKTFLKNDWNKVCRAANEGKAVGILDVSRIQGAKSYDIIALALPPNFETRYRRHLKETLPVSSILATEFRKNTEWPEEKDYEETFLQIVNQNHEPAFLLTGPWLKAHVEITKTGQLRLKPLTGSTLNLDEFII